MLGLDTSIVVRLIIGEPQDLYSTARHRLQTALEKNEQVVVSDLVIGEAYYALQHHYDMPKTEACSALRRFLKSGIVVSDPPTISEALTSTQGAGVLDRLIHLRYNEIGAVTHTYDEKQARFKGAVRLKS